MSVATMARVPTLGGGQRAYAKLFGRSSVVLAVLTWPGVAPAATPPPPEDVPAVSAYVELVPGSRGSRSPGRTKPRHSPLPKRVETALVREGGEDAALLEEVATSSAYGAPEREPRDQSRGQPRPPRPVEPADDDAFSAAVSVATDGDDRRLLALGLAMIGISLLTVAGVSFQRRTRV
jgi:hypothetical protein